MSEVLARGASPAAIEHHYDVGSDFYKAWLGAELVYTAARWSPHPDRTVVRESLDEAQRAKLDYHLRALALSRGGRLLDIGCGWGSLLQYAAENALDLERADGVTLSTEQAAYIAQTHPKPVSVQKISYTDFEPDCAYHGVSTIGALEHFASPELSDAERANVYQDYFARVAGWLETGGRLSLQTITWTEQVDRKDREKLLALDIFPETEPPYVHDVFQSATGLRNVYFENATRDYVLTLTEWLRNFRSEREYLTANWGEPLYNAYEAYLRKSIVSFRRGQMYLCRFVFEKP